jgi:ribonuclease T2
MLALQIILAGAALSTSVAAVAFGSPADTHNLFKRLSSGCSTSGPASCHNTTKQTDLCCFEAPGVRVYCVIYLQPHW